MMKQFRLPAIATLLSLIACYGSLLTLAALGAMGVTVALHEGAWALAIVAFAALAVFGLFAGRRRHGANPPLVLGFCGAAALAYAMFVTYSRPVEIGGFGLLICAAWLDWRRS